MSNNEKYQLSDKELRAIQLKELESLSFFKEFCEKHDIKFFCCGGCCIGALRHQGFIPWDDDIDVFMMRNDYEKLIRLWKKENNDKRFVLLKTDDELFTSNVFATIVDTETTLIKTYQADLDIPHGLVLDVFPLDNCPNGYKRKLQLFWTLIYSLYLAQVVPVNHGKIVSLGGKILLSLVPSKKLRSKIWRYAEKQMIRYNNEDCEYITELCAGPHYMVNKYPKEIFNEAIYKKFENIEIPIPVGYDKYLSIAYGDYMKLPPKEEQVPQHDILFYDLENGYKKYKGKEYCKDKN